MQNDDGKYAIAIVGIGDAFETQYWKQLSSLNLNRWNVYCLDNSLLWGPNVKERRAETLKRISDADFKFFDIQTEDNFQEFIRSHKLMLVVLAVPDFAHVAELRRWLNAPDVGQILVEKPLSNDIEEVQRLLAEVGTKIPVEKLDKVKYFDHYRGKVHTTLGDPIYRDGLQNPKGWDLGEIKRVRFFCLEDFTGTDAGYLNRLRKSRISPERNGSIEIAGREKTLGQGMIFDLGSHLFALLEYFGKISTVELKEIRAGRYVGVGDRDAGLSSELRAEDGSTTAHLMRTTKIRHETFAAFKFGFESYRDKEISGEAFIGKGVRGINFPNSFDLNLEEPLIGEVKLLELHGETGRKVQFFLKTGQKLAGRAKRIIDKNGKILREEPFDIPDAHRIAFDEALAPEEGVIPRLFLTVGAAAGILEKLDEIQSTIRTKVLPFYSLGRRARSGGSAFENQDIISYPEYLDSLMARFEPVWTKATS